MSELINNRDNRTTIRWKLLTSASALALTAAVSSTSVTRAEDADRPLIWIELGGQMESVSGQGEVFAPPFLANNPDSSVLWNGVTPLQAQRPPKFGFGEDGKISFQPEDSDWIFSAAIRYGRSGNAREVEHQTSKIFYTAYKYGAHAHSYGSGIPGGHATNDFSDTHVRHQESHAILDFQAGRDFGLGLFGKDGSSVLNFGVRFAQFASKASFDIRARPDLQFKYLQLPTFHLTIKSPYFHTYHATGQASRNFQGVGPSLSWSGSAPFVGNQVDGEIAFDWGVNAALLFGKQKARLRDQETAHYEKLRYHLTGHPTYPTAYPTRVGGHNNVHSVTVPNVGGQLGISFRKGDAKVSFGYRADFFFDAMDTGIDAVKKSNVTFNGPYASISVGLGD